MGVQIQHRGAAADIQAALRLNGCAFGQRDRALKGYLRAFNFSVGTGTQVFEHACLQLRNIRSDGYGRAF